MMRYNPAEIEPKWQLTWDEQKTYQVSEYDSRPKIYISPMFPYPSGAGMHAGHAFEHAIVDAIARFYRQQGMNVLNPMGWDAFGLPTENYAIKSGIAPSEATAAFITNFKKQIKRLGSSIDWSREINTTDPEYYRWTQWVFIQLFNRGLAYQKEALQWWCPVDKTVLANEQVEGGRCWRCGTEVVKKSMNQWFFKITDYADALLDEIPSLDWPNKIKTAQINWIGKSIGATIEFSVQGKDDVITVFSTRPDTLFGATFLVLAPEHPLVMELATAEMHDSVTNYVNDSVKESEIERMNDTHEKTGVFTGNYAVNPATGEKIPIWIADYVLSGYGTGAIMAVPAHDERDFEFAEKFRLPVTKVIEAPANFTGDVYQGEGNLVNSGAYDGMETSQAREELVAWLEQEGTGRSKTTYKMRDWLISRQRYWGAPIPIIHCPEHGAVAVPDDQLPVILPEVKDYAPKGDGKSTLANVDEWVNTTCPTCQKPARRETDTMDGYACSSWYLLRYTDPHNNLQAWDPAKANYWSPLDFYVGGDHAVAHLLYVRFWTHVFKEMGLTDFKEPVKKLVYHGYVNAPDGAKMSKSKGNVIDPLEIIAQGYGADALRTYLLFMGPIELDAPWDPRGISGVYRFLNRVWVLAQEFNEANKSNNSNDLEVRRLQHATIKKVTDDYRRLSFNTAIASLMQSVNDLYKLKLDGFSDEAWREALGALVRLLAPMAPHMSAELWQQLGNQSQLEEAGWPIWDESLLTSQTMNIIVQVNGKVRANLTLPKSYSEDKVKTEALKADNVAKFVGNKQPTKLIYVPGRLVNIVI